MLVAQLIKSFSCKPKHESKDEKYFSVAGLRITPPVMTANVSSNTNSAVMNPLTPLELQNGCRLGTDSHAEVTCYGRHARITHVHEGMTSNVSPFHDSYAPMQNVKFANACFAYDAEDGKTYILHHYYGLDFTHNMNDSILCTNQSRANGVIVDDVPKQFDRQGTSTHSISFPDENVTIPLSMHNSISYLPVRYPTDEDMNNGIDVHLSDDFPWDPTLFCTNQGRSISSLSIEDVYESYMPPEDPILSDILSSFLNVSSVRHNIRKDIDAEKLADLWHISITNAARTLKCVDMDRIRETKGKIHRRFKTKVHQRRYKQLGGYLAQFAADIFESNVVSLRGNKYMALFCNKANFCASYALKKKSDAYHALDRFLHEIGVPMEMLTDGARELVMSEWGKICRKHKIYQVQTEPHSPWQNPAEKNGGLIKRKTKHLMQETNTPVVLWDYCWEYATAIRSLVAVDNIYLDDVTPFQKVHGYIPNISEYTTFKWFEWVRYHEPTEPEKSKLGRWLGPAHNAGQGLCYYILTDKGKVVTRSTVIPIPIGDIETIEMRDRMTLFTNNINEVIGDFTQSSLDRSEETDKDPFRYLFEEDALDDEHIDPQEVDDLGNPIIRPDLDDIEHNDEAFKEQFDPYVGLKVPLARGGEMQEATVRSRKRNPDGSLKGTANDNIALDTRVYEVEFPDGSYNEYATNTLIENLFAHVDDEGMHHAILKGIVDHKRLDDAVDIADGMYIDKHGASRRVITTKGWRFKVEWNDGTSSWVPLSVIKESNPLEVAQYVKSRDIIKEPAFAWWCPHVIKKAHRIIKATTHRAVRKKIKYGVVVPDDYDEALDLDVDNGNDLWTKAIEKEVKNVRVAFKVLEDGESPPVGSKEIPYHLVFDVKFDLTRKARLVAGGHRNKGVPAHATFSSVAARDSVRLAFLFAALNDLDILSADIGNAFLNAPPRERCHVILGPDIFGKEHENKIAIVVRALYGLKTASAAWRHHFSTFVREHLGFESTYADPDVYRKPMVKANGMTYYAYLVIYVDDVLCIEENPKVTMDKIEGLFRLKDGVESPTMYLGTDTKKWKANEDGTEIPCWAIGSESYLNEAVKTAETNFRKHKLDYSSSRSKGRDTPFKYPDYRPELDTTELCDDDLISLYQNLIGILRWTCELGRVDILHETSLLSQYLAQPRLGHLQEVINIFYYLKYHKRSWNVMNPCRFDIEWCPRTKDDVHPRDRANAMKEIYPDAVDLKPYNMPEPRGNAVDITAWVDADHAGNRVTRRSHTGIIIFVNMAPIVWYSKRQNTVETSTFGSEFIALKICVELIESLVYKLRMFGIPIEGEARVLCDNESVVKSSSYPESSLKKKHCSVAYHKVRENVAAGKVLIYYEESKWNLADLLTKPLSASKRRPLVQAILH